MKCKEQYGNSDVGLLFIFFLNVLNPKPGQSFICSPDEPHAYLQGELIEAMVNSDNVVRGGLTPKYKDKETLTEMLIYKFNDVKISDGEVSADSSDSVVVKKYPTGYRDFCVTNVSMASEAKYLLPKFPGPAIAFVLDGDMSAEWAGMKSEFTMKGK